MSDEPSKDVSPFRLKRPQPAGNPPDSPAGSDSLPADAASPAPPAPSVSSGSDAGIQPAPTVPLRRRPTLPSDPSPPPGGQAGKVITGDTLIGALPGTAAPAPAPQSDARPVPPPIKLRIGAKPPPMPAPPLGDDPFPVDAGAPLVPLPGLPGMPSLAPLPPLPGQPPAPPSSGRLPGTALIGGAPGGKPASDHRMGGADAPLMPLSMAGTRPPFSKTAANKPEPRRDARKTTARRDLLIFALLFTVLAAAGVGAYFYLMKPQASSELVAGVKEKLEKAAELPGKAVDSAKESIANARQLEQARADSVADGEDVPERRGINARSPAEIEAQLKASNEAAKPSPPAPPAATATAPAGAYSGEAAQPKASAVAEKPTPSARFIRYADGVKISGVFQGRPPRALLDGRIISAGDMVEPTLGIQFIDVDPATKHLILQEASGAQLRVKY